MKKVLLGLFGILFVANSFANTIAANMTNPVCDNATLDKYNGTANVEINWEPNVIALRWYDGENRLTVPTESQSCVYDGAMVIPSAPTRTGYTFKGWKVIDVPDGYTKIEYLQSTGTQWIDTGIIAPNGFRARAGVYLAQQPDANRACLFMGSHNPLQPYGRNYISVRNIVEVGSGTCFQSDYYVQENTRYDIEASTVKNNVFLVDGNLRDVCRDGDTSRSTNNIYLFRINFHSSEVYCHWRIYYVEIYNENDILVGSFIPVRRKSDNVVGMYDKVSGQFFTNSGTGSFIAGPVVQ